MSKQEGYNNHYIFCWAKVKVVKLVGTGVKNVDVLSQIR